MGGVHIRYSILGSGNTVSNKRALEILNGFRHMDRVGGYGKSSNKIDIEKIILKIRLIIDKERYSNKSTMWMHNYSRMIDCYVDTGRNNEMLIVENGLEKTKMVRIPGLTSSRIQNEELFAEYILKKVS